MHDGPFNLDYRWMMESYDPARVREWADDSFSKVDGTLLGDFEFISAMPSGDQTPSSPTSI